MSITLFKIILGIIPIIGLIITGYIIPLIKTKIDEAQYSLAVAWVNKAVLAAEVLFKDPKAGKEKREYVINFINEKINKKKEIITKEQIRILLEAAWKETIEVKEEL